MAARCNNRDPEVLASRYVAGRTLRQIGAEVGLSHFTVRYHLQKLKHYRSMVTRILLARVRAAERAYSITRARERQRRLKHALAMLRQKRPALYAQLLERSKPTTCSGCHREIQATLRAFTWCWSCAWCGDAGRIPALDLSH